MPGAERPCLPRTLGQGLALGFAAPEWRRVSRERGEEAREAQGVLLGRARQGPSGGEELVPTLGRIGKAEMSKKLRPVSQTRASEGTWG